MREMIIMALALVILTVNGENSGEGQCLDGKCFTVHTDSANFDAARRVCEEKGGHLMTLSTEKVADVLVELLNGTPGDFWLGLRDDRCPDSSDKMRGYKWIGGKNTGGYFNWKTDKAVCTPMCVSVSAKDHKWTERPCDDKIEGFLCQYESQNYCPPLSSHAPVLYETPFGFTANELLKEIPQQTNATLQPLGTKHVCFEGTWLKAPWSCEVFNGGCDYKCVSNAQSHSCICEPGFNLDGNGVSCSRTMQDDDPCARAGCQHSCTRVGNVVACTCTLGFQLGADGKSCEECKPGFRYENGGCVDEDECESAPCEHDCFNTKGGYHCECMEGFKVSMEDKNKCVMHCAEYKCPAQCDPNNNAQCNCPDGFLLDEESLTCEDIDECDDTNNCDHECKNTPGDYECICKEGFLLVGKDKCVTEDFEPEGSGSPTTFDNFIPTSRPPTERPMSVSAGSLLGIMICIVVCILLLVCIVHFIMKRLSKMHNYDMHKGHDEIYFQQVITEQNHTQSLPDRYLKRDT